MPGAGRGAVRTGLAATAALTFGCETERTTRSRLVGAPAPMAIALPAAGAPYAGVRVMGSVPFDDRTLPLVSPDGHFIATQAGPTADWETILAAAGASTAVPGTVEIYRCDPGGETAALVARPQGGLLLGRSADASGVLVESPRPGGARWIGRLGWLGGPVEWLVADDRVNAFAALGPEGRLAWSRRAPDGRGFDLVVRGDEEWSLPAGEGDWLMPAWSADPAGLFALRLEAGRLDAVFMDARGPEAAGRTSVRLGVAQSMTARDAWQCFASGAGVAGLTAGAGIHLVFWHPGAGRMALWRPVDSPGAADLLERGSVAAAIDRSGFLLVTTADRLAIADPSRGGVRTLLPGPLVPRATSDPRWPWVLLLPRPGEIGLLALRIESAR